MASVIRQGQQRGTAMGLNGKLPRAALHVVLP